MEGTDSLDATPPSKAPREAFQACGAFQAAARPLLAGVSRRPSPKADAASPTAESSAGGFGASTLAELAEGPYLHIAMQLDASTLCRTDSTCRLMRALNRANVGPWRALGARAFYGMELERDEVFEAAEADEDADRATGCRKQARVDWKGRFGRFRREVATFRAPFAGPEIAAVRHPDEVAYCRLRLRTDLLSDTSTSSDMGVYLEVEVISNPDNLSLAVVDFEAGGRSSVTFSPDTGAVIRERKVREAPRKVEGEYIQPLTTTPPGRRFEGSMGLYLRGGHLAFFRRCTHRPDGDCEPEVGPWESTGFITDIAWAEGRRLTPCLAFRDEGMYRVRVVRVGSRPPHVPERSLVAYEGASWSGLDWEAGQPMPPTI